MKKFAIIAVFSAIVAWGSLARADHHEPPPTQCQNGVCIQVPEISYVPKVTMRTMTLPPIQPVIAAPIPVAPMGFYRPLTFCERWRMFRASRGWGLCYY